MLRNSKTEFLRGVSAFNPISYRTVGTPQDIHRLQTEIKTYDHKKGGLWNYNNLYEVVKAVLRGYPADQARENIAALDGMGEAVAKLTIFDGLRKTIPFEKANLIEEGGRVMSFGRHEVSIRPDFSYKTDTGIFCVFVYPYKERPLKDVQKNAIVKVLAAQEHDEPYSLVLAECPAISGRRVYSDRIYPFTTRSMDQMFVQHMATFYDFLDAQSERRGLFDE